jgi:AbrB family looped-hinge helix DNA binding protein
MGKPKGKYAWTVKVGEKGQIVIPKEAREVFNIHPGDTLILLGDVEQGLAIPPKSLFSKLVGIVFGGNMPNPDKENQ